MTEQQQILAALADTYHLDTMYAFGSQCEKVLSFFDGESERPPVPSSSDVDIAVRPIPGYRLSVRDKALLAAELEDLLQVSHVDLVLLPEADPFLAVNAIRGEPITAETRTERTNTSSTCCDGRATWPTWSVNEWP